MAKGFIDLKRKPEDFAPTKMPAKEEGYYPLSLYLGGDEIKKIGLADFRVGEEFLLECRVRVTSLSVSDNTDYGPNASMTLTILAANAEPDEKESSDTEKAHKMYPTMKGG